MTKGLQLAPSGRNRRNVRSSVVGSPEERQPLWQGYWGAPRTLFPLPRKGLSQKSLLPRREKVRACPECAEGMRGCRRQSADACVCQSLSDRRSEHPHLNPCILTTTLRGRGTQRIAHQSSSETASKGRVVQGDGSVCRRSRVRPQCGTGTMTRFSAVRY